MTSLENAVQIVGQLESKLTSEISRDPLIYIQLVREYLRRLVQWHRALGDVEFPRVNAFMIITSRIDPDSKLPNEVVLYLRETYPNHFKRMTIGNYLLWLDVKANLSLTYQQLLDPYEPLIYFYRLGGSLYMENNILFVESGDGIPVNGLSCLTELYDTAAPFISDSVQKDLELSIHSLD